MFWVYIGYFSNIAQKNNHTIIVFMHDTVNFMGLKVEVHSEWKVFSEVCKHLLRPILISSRETTLKITETHYRGQLKGHNPNS